MSFRTCLRFIARCAMIGSSGKTRGFCVRAAYNWNHYRFAPAQTVRPRVFPDRDRRLRRRFCLYGHAGGLS